VKIIERESLKPRERKKNLEKTCWNACLNPF
jgi:hypothetical protein